MRRPHWLPTILLCGLLAPDAHGLPARSARPSEPADLVPLLGEYGAPEVTLTVYEAGGRLYANGDALPTVPLHHVTGGRFVAAGDEAGPTLDFQGAPGMPAVAVALNGIRLPRRDRGAEIVRLIRTGVRADLATLRATALGATPPVEAEPARADDLVDLATIDASIRFDIRYATTNNFMGRPMYERPGAYLQRPAAEALGRVAGSLAPLGYGLVVYDAYRPWFVTKMFWDATPDAAHIFVADPAAGSRHNRGCAVDLSLYDRVSGRVVRMTGRYDEMSPRSFADYVGGTSRERWLRDLLRQAMEQQGFTVYAQEWWHFDYKDWHDYGLGNVPFERLEAATRPPPQPVSR